MDISEILIPSSLTADKQVWGLSPDGVVYYVKSGARLAQGLGIHPPDHVKFLWIWDLPIPPKIKFFLWKICMDGLPTKARLEKSHVFFPQDCVLCNFHCEDSAHVLFGCPVVQDVAFSLHASGDWPLIHCVDLSSDIVSIFVRLRSSMSRDHFCKLSVCWKQGHFP